jgi:chorismate mutase/prephenate dehydratase
VFFVDIDGHADEEPAKTALDEVRTQAELFRVLGAYPKAVF